MIYITDKDYEIAKKNGISKNCVYNRVYNCSWDIERAITIPLKSKLKTSEMVILEEKLKQIGISKTTYYNRKKAGWNEEELLKPRGYRRLKKSMFTEEEINAAIELGLDKHDLYNRKKAGWGIDEILSTPKQKPGGNRIKK